MIGSVGLPSISWQRIPAILFVMFLAIVLDFCLASSIGLLAFVTEDTFSFRLIYQKLMFILGGLLIPLDFLPEWLQRIARILPFSQVTYAPAKLFVAFSWHLFLGTVLLQLIWILIMGFWLFLQYRWATRRMVVNGG